MAVSNIMLDPDDNEILDGIEDDPKPKSVWVHIIYILMLIFSHLPKIISLFR